MKGTVLGTAGNVLKIGEGDAGQAFSLLPNRDCV